MKKYPRELSFTVYSLRRCSSNCFANSKEREGRIRLVRTPAPENEVQRNIRVKVCARTSATKKCNGWRHRTYCNKKCQKNDWKTVHKKQCKKLQQVFVPPPAEWRKAKEVPVVVVVAAVVLLRQVVVGC